MGSHGGEECCLEEAMELVEMDDAHPPLVMYFIAVNIVCFISRGWSD